MANKPARYGQQTYIRKIYYTSLVLTAKYTNYYQKTIIRVVKPKRKYLNRRFIVA
jgi:hypothetical protein